MASYAVVKSIRPDQLHNEFFAIHGNKISSVRGINPDANGVCSSGAVIHDGTLSDAQLDAVINAHSPTQTSQQKLKAIAITNIIAKLENGNASSAEIQNVLAKVLRYLRQEALS